MKNDEEKKDDVLPQNETIVGQHSPTDNINWLKKYGYIDDDKETLKAEYLSNMPDIESEEETERKIRGKKAAQNIANFATVLGTFANVLNVNAGAVNQQITPQTKPIDYDAIREKYRNARNVIKQYKNKASEYVQGILDKRAAAAKAAAGVAQGERRLAEAERHNAITERLQAVKAQSDAQNKAEELQLKREQQEEAKNYHRQSIGAKYATSRRTTSSSDKYNKLYVPSNGTTYYIPSNEYRAIIDQLAGIAGISTVEKYKTKDAVKNTAGQVIQAEEYGTRNRNDKDIIADIVKQAETNPDLQDALNHFATNKTIDNDAAKKYQSRHAGNEYKEASANTAKGRFPLYNPKTRQRMVFDTEAKRDAYKKRYAEKNKYYPLVFPDGHTEYFASESERGTAKQNAVKAKAQQAQSKPDAEKSRVQQKPTGSNPKQSKSKPQAENSPKGWNFDNLKNMKK